MLVGVRCRVSGVRENLTPNTWSPTPASLLATSATGPHPFPSRTRSLSLSAPMVLRLRGRGRVGRRQLLLRMSNVQYRMSNFEIRYSTLDILHFAGRGLDARHEDRHQFVTLGTRGLDAFCAEIHPLGKLQQRLC